MKQKYVKYKKKSNKSIITLNSEHKFYVPTLLQKNIQDEVDLLITLAVLLNHELEIYSIDFDKYFTYKTKRKAYSILIKTHKDNYLIFFNINKNNNILGFCQLTIFYRHTTKSDHNSFQIRDNARNILKAVIECL